MQNHAYLQAHGFGLLPCKEARLELMFYHMSVYSGMIRALQDEVSTCRCGAYQWAWFTLCSLYQLCTDTLALLQVVKALEVAQKEEKPPLSCMFSDVYAEMPWHLKEQQAEVADFIRRHPDMLPKGMPLDV